LSQTRVRSIKRIVLSASLALLGANVFAQESSPIPRDAGVCDRIYADIAQTETDLQSILDRCDWDSDGFVLALRKLNRLPPPAALKSVVLKPHVEGRPTFRTTYEIDVFFHLLQSYPHPLAFAKLEQLVDKMSSGYEVSRIEIIGYSDANEREEVASMSLDTKRADFMRQYFLAVGIPPDRITSTTGVPRHGDTAQGRARDRSAAIKVYGFRQD
jgi:hypothetical protein